MNLYVLADQSIEIIDIVYNDQGVILKLKNGTHVQWNKEFIHKHIQRKSDLYIVSYGKNPVEIFQTDKKEVIQFFIQNFPRYGFSIEDSKKSGFLKIIILFLVLLGGISLFYTIGLDLMAKAVSNMIPIETEEKIGKSLYQQTVNENIIHSEKTKFLDSFFMELKYSTPYTIKTVYINDSTVNAFAMPGGYIVVMSGIIKHMNSYEELAALFGHELTHINHKHVTRSLVRSVGSYLMISTLVGDLSGIVAVLAENANTLKSLEYSRSLETESDETGFLLLKEHRINPQGMIQLFNHLDESNSVPTVSNYLSTHPNTSNRIEHIQELISQQPYQSKPNKRLEYLFLRIKN